MINTVLGNVLEFKRGYDLTEKEQKKGTVPVVGSNGIIGYHNRDNSPIPCLTVGRSGTVGIPHIYDRACWVHNTALYVTDFKGNNPFYLYYLLKNIDLNKVSVSTGVPTLNRNFIHPLKIQFIDNKTIQDKIVTVLKSLDEKIKNNYKISIELESLLKTIYDYWFLQFEFPNDEGKPYKSSGGKMVWNEEFKREIPEGWSIKKIGDLAIEGKNVPFSSINNTPTLDLSVMPSGSMFLSKFNESNNFGSNLFEMKKNDILFGSIRPYLKKAGIAPLNGAVTGTVHVFRPIREMDYNFLAITICNNRMFNFGISRSQGTKMPVVTIESLMNYKVAYDSSIVEMFNSINFKDIITNYANENQELVSLRDFLIPLLMNGQITFKES